jgi:hypothetical protein
MRGESIVESEGGRWDRNGNRQVNLYDIKKPQQLDNGLVYRMTYLHTVITASWERGGEGVNASSRSSRDEGHG